MSKELSKTLDKAFDASTVPTTEVKSLSVKGHSFAEIDRQLRPLKEEGWCVRWKMKSWDGYVVELERTHHPQKCECEVCKVPAKDSVDKELDRLHELLGYKTLMGYKET